MGQILQVNDLHVYYGSIHAVKGVSFEVNEGEVVTLIGANGAGKSTVLNTVAGLLHPKHGSVVFEGKDLKGVPAHKIVEHGLAQRVERAEVADVLRSDLDTRRGRLRGRDELGHGRGQLAFVHGGQTAVGFLELGKQHVHTLGEFVGTGVDHVGKLGNQRRRPDLDFPPAQGCQVVLHRQPRYSQRFCVFLAACGKS